ncbi:MAG: hypothetical protein N3G76_02625 [Candidatus Micrarchaeota archaeon]|nr:hypothetical protein [Candidatus Micrarchaeota archaeon]
MECSFRGLYNSQLAGRISSTVSSLGLQGIVAVAADTRPSSHSLLSAVSAALLGNGNTVHNLGIIPTPTLAYYSKAHGCVGIMITASHNPEQDNGIKIFLNGKEALGIAPKPPAPPSGTIISVNPRTQYFDALLRQVDLSPIRKSHPKVIVDCGNGAGGAFTPFILRAAGAHVITIDAECSHPFAREPEPEHPSLSYLPSLVSETGADFAIVHDADADRCRIVTADGMMAQDVQLLNVAAALCGQGDTLVTTVEASRMVQDELEKAGVRTVVTPVGSNFVARAVESLGAVFGGEPCGEYVFPRHMYSADGILAALVLTRIYCERGGFAKYATYATIRSKIEVAKAGGKELAISKLREALVQDPGVRIISEQDGVLFEYGSSRVLVRKSNTQDIIRITCEDKDDVNARKSHDWVKKVLEERCL